MKWIIVSLAFVACVAAQCNPSPTTASGSHAPGQFCSGELIFEDNFDSLDESKWMHDNTLAGGGNWEFQWYLNDRQYSFTENGILYLRPGLTSDVYGEEFLTSGHVQIPANECTESQWYGCDRQGTPENIINPARSAKLRTTNSFAFKFGRVEINAKLPAGDWLWPALWFLPKDNVYGWWPSSGEIDLMESRGNRNMMIGGVNIGVEQMGSTLHFGPSPDHNGWPTAHQIDQAPQGKGWNNDFHRYGLEWTPQYMKFSVDGAVFHTIDYGSGFWDRGNFANSGYVNPWAGGSVAAPFDQEFYVIMNNAVGGINYFPDDASNPGGKPWHNQSPTAMTDFWNGRSQWLPTWNRDVNDGRDAALQVNYVRIWAL